MADAALEAFDALVAKLGEAVGAAETDVIAAEAHAAAAPPTAAPPRGRAPSPSRPAAALSDDELADRFTALENADTPVAGSLELALRRELRARRDGGADDLEGGPPAGGLT